MVHTICHEDNSNQQEGITSTGPNVSKSEKDGLFSNVTNETKTGKEVVKSIENEKKGDGVPKEEEPPQFFAFLALSVLVFFFLII